MKIRQPGHGRALICRCGSRRQPCSQQPARRAHSASAARHQRHRRAARAVTDSGQGSTRSLPPSCRISQPLLLFCWPLPMRRPPLKLHKRYAWATRAAIGAAPTTQRTGCAPRSETRTHHFGNSQASQAGVAQLVSTMVPLAAMYAALPPSPRGAYASGRRRAGSRARDATITCVMMVPRFSLLYFFMVVIHLTQLWHYCRSKSIARLRTCAPRHKVCSSYTMTSMLTCAPHVNALRRNAPLSGLRANPPTLMDLTETLPRAKPCSYAALAASR